MINKNYLFASHYPLLTEMLLKTDGDIIEFGTGLWSTVLLHIFASPERKVYSVENDDFWLDKVLYLKNDYHLFFHNSNELPDKQCSLALVDASPQDLRMEHLRWAALHCEYVLLHDAGHPPNIEEGDKLFKYKKFYKEFEPWTVLFSNKQLNN